MAERGILGENLFGTRESTRGPINRYPLWRYLLILLVVALGFLYAAPNLFPPDYALQISPDGSDRPVDEVFLGDAVAALESMSSAANSCPAGRSSGSGPTRTSCAAGRCSMRR